MIQVKYQARLGNNLFQYCLGRILAEELGFALEAGGLEGFPETHRVVAGGRHEHPEERVTGQLIDLAGILANRTPRRLAVEGWFQRAEYYRPYRTRIREWLRWPEKSEPPRAVEKAVVVNVRRTDYVQLGWALPFSFYEEAIERCLPSGGEVWIVTEDARDPFFRQFARWRPKFFNAPAVEQIACMARARCLVMSQSTFSWWGAFLGDQEQVVCPVPGHGIWSPNREEWCRGAELVEQDEFCCLACDDAYVPGGIESAYQTWRRGKRRWIIRLNHHLRTRIPVPMP